MWKQVVLAVALSSMLMQQVQAQSTSTPVVSWTSSTAYVVFDGTPQAKIIGSGVVPSGSTAVALGKPQIETSALVTGKAISRGVAATDSKIVATIKGIGSALAGDVASGSACSGGGIWGFIGCTALSAVVSVAVALGLDKLWSWLFGANQVTASTAGTHAYTNVAFGGQTFSTPDAACAYMTSLKFQPGGTWSPVASDTYGNYMCVSSNGGNAVYLQDDGIPGNTYGAQSVSQAVTQLPSSELSQPASPDTTADMVNALWNQASSQSGYVGVPYDPSNPITAGDVTTWESNNPSFAPTLGDDLGIGAGVGAQGNSSSSGALSYIPSSGTSSDGSGPAGNPSSGTGTGTSTGTGTDTSTGASGTSTTSSSTADFCQQDPTASACASLGSAPSAPALPSSSVSVSMAPWTVGPAFGLCPAPVAVSFLNAQISLSYGPVCLVAQKIRPVVLAICGLLAALIVALGVSL